MGEHARSGGVKGHTRGEEGEPGNEAMDELELPIDIHYNKLLGLCGFAAACIV